MTKTKKPPKNKPYPPGDPAAARTAAPDPAAAAPEPAPAAPAPAPERERTLEEIIAESREALKVPPEPGQRYFEAPNGYIQTGSKEEQQVWCRYVGEKGAWINPRR